MLDLNGRKALGPDNNLMVGVTLPLDLNCRQEGRVGVRRVRKTLAVLQSDNATLSSATSGMGAARYPALSETK